MSIQSPVTCCGRILSIECIAMFWQSSTFLEMMAKGSKGIANSTKFWSSSCVHILAQLYEFK